MRSLSWGLLIFLIFTVTPLCFGQLPHTDAVWIRDLDEAKLAAAESDKDIFVLFTGRGWCGHCEKLHEYLFKKPHFVEYLEKQFVLVELDFNFGDTRQEQVRHARYSSWQKRYLVPGFPTMVFADKAGNPFFISQRPNDELDEFIDRIDAAVERRVERDTHFAAARELEGKAKAMKLFSGLSAISRSVSIDDETDSPYVFHFYPQEALTILATSSADKELLEIQGSYRKRIEGLARTSRKDRVLERVKELRRAEHHNEAIKTLEHELTLCETFEERLGLLHMLSDVCKYGGEPEKSLTFIDEILATRPIDDRLRQRLQSKRVELLFDDLQRTEQAIASTEQWIANSEPGSREHWGALAWKAKILSVSNPGSPEAISAWKSARDASELHNNDWLTCTSAIAEAEIAAGNPDRGAALYDQILSLLEKRRTGEPDSHFPWTWTQRGAGILIVAADAHAKSGNHAAALERLLRAEADIESALKECDPLLNQKVDSFCTRLEEVRASISKERANEVR